MLVAFWDKQAQWNTYILSFHSNSWGTYTCTQADILQIIFFPNDHRIGLNEIFHWEWIHAAYRETTKNNSN